MSDFERRRMRVYCAGPISSDVMGGVHRGIAAGRQMFLDGLAPFVPHFDAFWFLPDGNWNAYLEYDLEYVTVCDALYRLSGPSKGADLEVSIAMSHGIKCFFEGTDFPGVGYSNLLALAARLGLNGKQEASC